MGTHGVQFCSSSLLDEELDELLDEELEELLDELLEELLEEPEELVEELEPVFTEELTVSPVPQAAKANVAHTIHINASKNFFIFSPFLVCLNIIVDQSKGTHCVQPLSSLGSKEELLEELEELLEEPPEDLEELLDFLPDEDIQSGTLLLSFPQPATSKVVETKHNKIIKNFFIAFP